MIAYGRFAAGGEIIEDYFEIRENTLIFEGEKLSIDEIKFLPPVSPEKIIGVGLNYKDHAEELNMDVPDKPVLFIKSPSSIVGDRDFIVLPEISQRVDYEGELAIVIGERCKHVGEDEAKEYILGYTCFNDVTARDLQQSGWDWSVSKSFDTFSPVGPYVSVSINPENLEIKTRLNGKVVQKSNTSNLVFNVYRLVSYISSVVRLKEGDISTTGTPAGVGRLKRGDTVAVEIEGIGKLTNYVR